MRGKSVAVSGIAVTYGITPACAGKMNSYLTTSRDRRDHPRVCGENRLAPGLSFGLSGSPPRVRGKCLNELHSRSVVGITPACAGKIGCVADEGRHGWDHPRVCGENCAAGAACFLNSGSPPRVRGKFNVAGNADRKEGITPACAGKILRKWRISVVDPSPQPRSSLTSRRADASIGSQRAPCAAPV